MQKIGFSPSGRRGTSADRLPHYKPAKPPVLYRPSPETNSHDCVTVHDLNHPGSGRHFRLPSSRGWQSALE